MSSMTSPSHYPACWAVLAPSTDTRDHLRRVDIERAEVVAQVIELKTATQLNQPDALACSVSRGVVVDWAHTLGSYEWRSRDLMLMPLGRRQSSEMRFCLRAVVEAKDSGDDVRILSWTLMVPIAAAEIPSGWLYSLSSTRKAF